jgi:hypothetical protein
MPAGRPSDYTQEIADLICERIADGESLRAICAGDDMPNKSTENSRPSMRMRAMSRLTFWSTK